jgi:hypothetical protein
MRIDIVGSRHKITNTTLRMAVYATVLLLAAYFGAHPSLLWLGLPVIGLGFALLLQRPYLSLLALIPAALIVPIELGTGTAVSLNPVTLLVPALLGLWALDMVRRRDFSIETLPTNKPLLLFLLAGLLSLLLGNALWDPAVPRSSNFIVVQLAQWAIFAFSAGAFWLTGNLVRKEVWLRRLTFLYLIIAGGLALAIALTGGANLVRLGVATLAVARAPFWVLLTALAGGQLLFNQKLATGWRLFLLAVLGSVFVVAFFLMRQAASNWVGVTATLGVLAWLRWPRLRWPVVVLLLVMAGSGLLTSTIYDFAGGDAEWQESGGSRLALIGRVVEVTMRNPITGLGPAAYRPYTRMKPLPYGKAFWIEPIISSHNNYVDLFSHVGLLGLGFFFWFAVELTRLGLRLRSCFTKNFAAGYVNAMLAAWAGSLTLMLFADWILPFVYNVGFRGFQASVLVWLFLGGLVTLDVMARREMASEIEHAT